MSRNRRNRRVRHALVWLFWLIVAAALARWSAVVALDRDVASALEPFGRAWPVVNLIWVLGGVPVTLLAVGGWTFTRRPYRWAALGSFFLGLGIEVLLKILIHTPLPRATPEPPFYARLEAATNVTPQRVLAWVGRLRGTAAPVGTASHILHGSFPSGHVYRLTLAVGLWCNARPAATWMTGILAGLMVVATGGHWAVDVMGGFALARLMLAWATPG
ncbi:MAG: phosphatase PAP2 family protein [Firmicutes bacterium]|nr:phosphatase PAP2 family protein [Bacillota bacterium]